MTTPEDNPNKMKDEKQQPTPEQIAQWKKDYEKWADKNESLHRNPYAIYVAGRQAAFEEDNDKWILSRERMPDFDGPYYVYGFMHNDCGTVIPFHMIVECRMNQWVKTDVGQQMTYWQPLLTPPKEYDIEQDPN